MHYRPLILLFAFLLTGTASAFHHNTTESFSSILENTSGMIGPDDFPPNVNPLTGLPVDDPAVLQRNPIVVKVSNAPPLVRPQAGIGAADLVFEHYAEGGLTRFSAIYYGQAPDRVGSIRSARLIDYELVPMYQGLLAFSGASIGVEDKLNTSEFANRIYKGVLFGLPYYWRDDAIPVPHNMFTNPNALWQIAEANGVNFTPELHGMVFDEAIPEGGTEPGDFIDLRYRATRVRWEYDSSTGLYHRFADGQGHYDANTQEQITAENVVILYADHRLTDIVESEFQGSVSYSIEIKLWFEGDAILFRDGQQFPARWVRPTREDLLGLRTLDGEFLPLKPGQTWYQVIRPTEQQTPEEEWLRIE
jgi:hypothetical protein